LGDADANKNLRVLKAEYAPYLAEFVGTVLGPRQSIAAIANDF